MMNRIVTVVKVSDTTMLQQAVKLTQKKMNALIINENQSGKGCRVSSFNSSASKTTGKPAG